MTADATKERPMEERATKERAVEEPAAAELATRLLDSAAREEQAAHRLEPGDDVPELRARIRRLARERGMRIRTAELDGVLLVIRADAAIWTDSTALMRWKLTPPEERTTPAPTTRRAARGSARSADRG